MKGESTLTGRIRSYVEERIVSGAWPPGTRIPFEHELTKQFDCSRMTASKAIGELVQAGLLERRRRAGTFVAHHEFESFVLEIPSIQAMVAQSGEAYAFDIITHRRRKAGSGRENERKLVGRGELLEIVGVHHAGATPFALEKRCINLAVVPAAADADFATTPPGSWLLKHVPWSRVQQKISAAGAGDSDAAMLKIAPDTPCLVVERQTWRNGSPVTWVQSVFPGDRYHLTAHFTPGVVKRSKAPKGMYSNLSTRKSARAR